MSATKKRTYSRFGQCRRCGAWRHLLPHRLCWPCEPCERDPQIRSRYASTSIFASRGVGLTPTKLPATPTSVPPGHERVELYRQRLERGEHWQHPEDAESS